MEHGHRRSGRVGVLASLLLVASGLAGSRPASAATPHPVVRVPLEDVAVPTGLAADVDRNLYVVDTGLSKAGKGPAGGGPQQVLGFSGLAFPTDVAVDAAGNVFVADVSLQAVLKLPAGGGAQQTVGFSGLGSPVGVTVDPAGNVNAVASGNLTKLTPGGTQTAFAVSSSTGDVEADDAGNVYLAGSDGIVRKYPGGADTPTALNYTGGSPLGPGGEGREIAS